MRPGETGIEMSVSVRLDLEKVRERLSGDQITALLDGIGKVVATTVSPDFPPNREGGGG